MTYEPINLESSFVHFNQLRIGEKFFFYCDTEGVGAEQLVKVSDDSYIGLGLNGNGFGGLGMLSERQKRSGIERLGMMSEERYAEITASYR